MEDKKLTAWLIAITVIVVLTVGAVIFSIYWALDKTVQNDPNSFNTQFLNAQSVYATKLSAGSKLTNPAAGELGATDAAFNFPLFIGQPGQVLTVSADIDNQLEFTSLSSLQDVVEKPTSANVRGLAVFSNADGSQIVSSQVELSPLGAITNLTSVNGTAVSTIVDGVSNAVQKDGSVTMTGGLNMGTNSISNVTNLNTVAVASIISGAAGNVKADGSVPLSGSWSCGGNSLTNVLNINGQPADILSTALLTSGSRPMAGTLSMGTNAIASSGPISANNFQSLSYTTGIPTTALLKDMVISTPASQATIGSGNVAIVTGSTAATVSQPTGDVSMRSGNSLSASASGTVAIRSGSTVSAVSGSVTIASGLATTGSSGPLTLSSGNSAGTAATGKITVSSGDNTSSLTGGIDIKTGDAVSTSGNILIQTGTGSTRGNIVLNGKDVTFNSVSTLGATALNVDFQVGLNGYTVNCAGPVIMNSSGQDVFTLTSAANMNITSNTDLTLNSTTGTIMFNGLRKAISQIQTLDVTSTSSASPTLVTNFAATILLTSSGGNALGFGTPTGDLSTISLLVTVINASAGLITIYGTNFINVGYQLNSNKNLTVLWIPTGSGLPNAGKWILYASL